MPYERRGVDTSTPEARAAVTDAIAAVHKAERQLANARAARNGVLRAQYARGVDVRDLVKIAHAAGWPSAAPNTLHTIVKGARPGS